MIAKAIFLKLDKLTALAQSAWEFGRNVATFLLSIDFWLLKLAVYTIAFSDKFSFRLSGRYPVDSIFY